MNDSKRDPQGPPAGRGQRFYGVYTAQVRDTQDPSGLGRVAITLPMLGKPASDVSQWARVAVPFAGNQRGAWLIPDVGDEVLVAFEGGEPSQPIVVGSLWNASDQPPEAMDTQNSRKSVVSRSGLKISLNDDSVSIAITTPQGLSVTLSDAENAVDIRDTSGNAIKLAPDGVRVSSPAKVTVSAAVVEIAGTVVTVNSSTAKFSGIVQCDTLIANSVVASSYTPGAGNLM